jgi:6-pyruvoyltetrahydropterin/6-carboxytetrahydropterin synthase
MYEIRVSSSFAAAHQLRNYGGKCERLHGHNWKVEVTVQAQELDQVGLAIDFQDVKKALSEVLTSFDHQNLNELALFKRDNPSSENVARLIHGELSALLSHHGVSVEKISVWESDACCASYIP